MLPVYVWGCTEIPKHDIILVSEPWGGSLARPSKGGEAYDAISDLAYCDPSGIAHCGNRHDAAQQKKIAAPEQRYRLFFPDVNIILGFGHTVLNGKLIEGVFVARSLLL